MVMDSMDAKLLELHDEQSRASATKRTGSMGDTTVVPHVSLGLHDLIPHARCGTVRMSLSAH